MQTLTTAVYWAVLHRFVSFPFADDPLLWTNIVLSHGVPLIALIIEQIIAPSDFDQRTLGFILVGLAVYVMFDAVLTLGSDGEMIAYFFLPWHSEPLVALAVCIILGLLLAGETAIFMHIW